MHNSVFLTPYHNGTTRMRGTQIRIIGVTSHGICISSVDQDLAASLGKRDTQCGVDLLAPFVSTRLAACDDWPLMPLIPCTPVLTIDGREATAIDVLNEVSLRTTELGTRPRYRTNLSGRPNT
jgi:hypothetical protein